MPCLLFFLTLYFALARALPVSPPVVHHPVSSIIRPFSKLERLKSSLSLVTIGHHTSFHNSSSTFPHPTYLTAPTPDPSSHDRIFPLSRQTPPGNLNDTEQRTTCFPAEATVRLSNGKTSRMDELRIGDQVETLPGHFSPIYLFTHRDLNTVSNFVHIRTSAGSLLVSGGHFIYIEGCLRKARDVRVGHTLQGRKGGVVLNITNVLRQGLFNPHTRSGDIMVDGILASVYTEAVSPNRAHALLAPLRALHLWSGLAVSALENDFLHRYTYLWTRRGVWPTNA